MKAVVSTDEFRKQKNDVRMKFSSVVTQLYAFAMELFDKLDDILL